MSPNLSPKTLGHRVGERWLIFFFIISLLASVGGIWALSNRWSTSVPMTILPPPTAAATPLRPVVVPQVQSAAPLSITVMIGGAVAKPGIYQLPVDATVADAVALAGGLASDADLSGFEISKILHEGAVIAIPALSDNSAEVALVNLNHATLEELESLPGIGPQTAQAILDNRPYHRLADLDRVPGIGESTINSLRGLVSFDE